MTPCGPTNNGSLMDVRKMHKKERIELERLRRLETELKEWAEQNSNNGFAAAARYILATIKNSYKRN